MTPLFKATDMREQGKKLMQMIAFCVKGLDALDQLVPAVQNLGKRHAGYGVTDAHYDTVGGACSGRWRRASAPRSRPT